MPCYAGCIGAPGQLCFFPLSPMHVHAVLHCTVNPSHALHCAVLQLRAISTGKASQVKACHAMRGALELLDFEDASINDMKRMLLQVC